MKRRFAGSSGRAFIGQRAVNAAMSSPATSTGIRAIIQSTFSLQGGEGGRQQPGRVDPAHGRLDALVRERGREGGLIPP